MISIGKARQLRREVRVALSAALLLGTLCFGASGTEAQHKEKAKQVEPAVAESAPTTNRFDEVKMANTTGASSAQ